MQTISHLRLVYSSARAMEAKRPTTLRERVQSGVDRTPFTFAAVRSCAMLALGSAERLWGDAQPDLDASWTSVNDKALLAVMPLTISLCVMTDVAAVASYPFRLWRATRPQG